MLINVVGRTGSGKSLYQSYLVYSELTRIMNDYRKIPWYDFWSTYSYYDVIGMNSDFDDKRGNSCRYDVDLKSWVGTGFIVGVNDLPDVYNRRNMLLFLDEAGTKFNNRDWDKMPDGYVQFLTTHRHNVTGKNKRFDMYLFTQQNDLVDITLRRLATRIYLIRPLFGFPKNPTRPRFYHRIPAIKIKIYHKHEVLEGKPYQELDADGTPVPVPPEDQLESLDFYTWYFFGKKYTSTYDTYADVPELKRYKK